MTEPNRERSPLRRLRRAIVRSLVVLALLAGGFVGWRMATNNFGVIVPGRVYRSGQMPAGRLGRDVRRLGIRTVLNLRGPNPRDDWYRREVAAATGAGATQVDVAMSSCQWMSRAQLRALIDVLDACDYPILIHCEWGAERTGLVAAFSELLRPGGSLESARAQFSARYLFVHARDGLIMAAHLEQYARWLARQGRPHSPERFRAWVDHGFRPEHPSREDWPYDPYPLTVITRPPARVGEVAGREAARRR